MARKHSPSSVDKLPPIVRETIGRLIAANVTLNDIVAALKELEGKTDVDFKAPSRSSLGRYADRLREAQARIARSRAMAEAFGSKFGDKPDDQIFRTNHEILQTVIMELLTAVDEDEETGEARPVTLDAKQVQSLAKSMQSLASAQKIDADRMLKIKQEFAKEAAEALDQVATAEGWSADTKQRLWDAVIGVAK